MLFKTVSLLAAAFLPTVFAQSQFLNPVAKDAPTTGFPEWNYGSNQRIRWSANFSTISLVLWQDYGTPQGTSYYDLLLDTVPYKSSLSYSVNTSIDLDPNNVFYFRLYDGNSSSSTFIESHMFEIVKAPSASTVYSTRTATVTGTAIATITEQAAQATGAAAAAASASPNSTSSSASFGGLMLAEKVGLGISLGVSIGLLSF